MLQTQGLTIYFVGQNEPSTGGYLENLMGTEGYVPIFSPDYRTRPQHGTFHQDSKTQHCPYKSERGLRMGPVLGDDSGIKQIIGR